MRCVGLAPLGPCLGVPCETRRYRRQAGVECAALVAARLEEVGFGHIWGLSQDREVFTRL